MTPDPLNSTDKVHFLFTLCPHKRHIALQLDSKRRVQMISIRATTPEGSHLQPGEVIYAIGDHFRFRDNYRDGSSIPQYFTDLTAPVHHRDISTQFSASAVCYKITIGDNGFASKVETTALYLDADDRADAGGNIKFEMYAPTDKITAGLMASSANQEIEVYIPADTVRACLASRKPYVMSISEKFSDLNNSLHTAEPKDTFWTQGAPFKKHAHIEIKRKS